MRGPEGDGSVCMCVEHAFACLCRSQKSALVPSPELLEAVSHWDLKLDHCFSLSGQGALRILPSPVTSPRLSSLLRLSQTQVFTLTCHFPQPERWDFKGMKSKYFGNGTYCLSRGPEFDSQHPIIPTSRDPVALASSRYLHTHN